MFTYEGGLLIGLILWIIYLFRTVILFNSRTQKNLFKVGKRVSLLGGIKDIDYKNESFFYKTLKFFFIAIFPIFLVLLSWLYVIPSIIYYIYVFYQDFSAPQKVKDFRWKLKNVDLTQDQIVRGLIEISDQDANDFEKIKKEINEDIERRKNA